MATTPELRIGDAEREATTGSLREHYAQGRLTLDELNERLGAGFAATTQSQLDRLTADLPHVPTVAAAPAPARPARSGRASRIALRAAVAAAVTLVALFLVLNFLRPEHRATVSIPVLIVGLLVLRAILFGGFGHHHHRRHHAARLQAHADHMQAHADRARAHADRWQSQANRHHRHHRHYHG
jgi:hypothetical protein